MRSLNYLPWVTTAITIAVTLIGVSQFNQKLTGDIVQESEARAQDFRKAFSESRSSVYMKTADLIGKISALPSDDLDRRQAEVMFHQVYFGQMVVVEDSDVKKAMIAFDDCLASRSEMCASNAEKQVQLQNLSIRTVTALRLSLGKVPEAKLEDLYRDEQSDVLR
jgi:hypothetical protein